MNKSFIFVVITVLMALVSAQAEPPVLHSRIGETITATNGALTITNIGKKQNRDYRDTATLDHDVFSPKSVNFHPDGTKYYVNSLEGCRTVVYDMATNKKIKVIHHEFSSGEGPLWNAPSGIYRFTHYQGGEKRPFLGKPVESCFSHGGRYLWVPYYRRTFDINAQDPSAVAIIDTRTDSIVRMMETGPLPKMITCSHDNHTIAITHWGNNTVGLVDITDPDPARWHHLPYVVVERELQLNFSLSSAVNRDVHSGLMLRGTVFTPDDRYLLVGCMGGGGIAVIDMAERQYVGIVGGISNARHLIIKNGYLYASVNAAGLVQRIPLDSVLHAIAGRHGKAIGVRGWQTCRVGGGARTIEASPSGRFIFAACNSASHLYVVDTRTMTAIGSITVDSYPVGLHISDDGRFLVVTSQARSGLGGNAVNLYRVDYSEPEVSTDPKPVLTDSIATDSVGGNGSSAAVGTGGITALNGPWLPWICTAAGALVLIVLWMVFRKKKK